MNNFFQNIWNTICEVFGFNSVEAISFSEYTIYHCVVALLGTALATAIIFFAIWLLIKILRTIWVFFKVLFSAKRRCQKIQCTTCGRTLDKCVCEKNKGKGYLARLILHSKEKKALAEAKKKASKSK